MQGKSARLSGDIRSGAVPLAKAQARRHHPIRSRHNRLQDVILLLGGHGFPASPATFCAVLWFPKGGCASVPGACVHINSAGRLAPVHFCRCARTSSLDIGGTFLFRVRYLHRAIAAGLAYPTLLPYVIDLRLHSSGATARNVVGQQGPCGRAPNSSTSGLRAKHTFTNFEFRHALFFPLKFALQSDRYADILSQRVRGACRDFSGRPGAPLSFHHLARPQRLSSSLCHQTDCPTSVPLLWTGDIESTAPAVGVA